MYALGTGVLLLVISLMLAPWIGRSGIEGLAWAAALAWPVQVGLFGLQARARDSGLGFLATWVLGSLVRLGVIAVAAVIAWLRPELTLPLLLGVAGFLFAMLLLEAPILTRFERRRVDREASELTERIHDGD